MVIESILGRSKMFKSEVRESTINDLLAKAEKRAYENYLPKLVLKKVRGFKDEPLNFDFPVTALIGPNGGGKTTALGAAACAYKSMVPRRFFAKSGVYDDSMQDWSIEYEIVDRKLNARDSVRRTATFKNARWNRDAPDRRVLLFGVSRTVPANEKSDMLRMANASFAVPEANIVQLSSDVAVAVSRILGKDASKFKRLSKDARGNIHLLTGNTPNGINYSEFHFGAGESSIIRMVMQIEAAPDSSLVLIEEIENGLHPVATVRLVEYLVMVAERKRIQVIFTTHSNEALLPLPSKAVWVAMHDRLLQGKLDIGALRAITGTVVKTAAIFVEDAFAKIWVEAILRARKSVLIDHIEVHAMEGDGIAVSANKHHNKNPATPFPSVCIIDGDSSQKDDPETGVFRLPGSVPESAVYQDVMDGWSAWGGKLSVALLREFESSEEIKKICEDVKRQNVDPHLIYAQIGERLGLVPETTVMGAFCSVWAQANPDKADAILSGVQNFIDKGKAAAKAVAER
ncbi:ATP-dependent nuclease [Agrobacterium pusense]|nr:ATP-binding protein [Agrobacterium pusense]